MMRRLLPPCLCLALVFPAAARAQIFGSTPTEEQLFGGSNPDLQAVLKLQYQMQMLKRLIERERAVNNMIESAIAIGVTDPSVPAPAYTLCRQLPANIICASAHAGIYENYSVEKVVPLLPITAHATIGAPLIPLNDAALPQ